MRVGDLAVGVRVNDGNTLEIVRGVLRPSLVEGVDASPNLSLAIGGQRGRVRDLHRLYRGSATVLRAPSLRRLLSATVAHLDAFLPAPEGLLPLVGDLMIGDGGAVIVRDVFGARPVPDRRLARLGFRQVDVVTPALDIATLEIVVTPARIPIDHDALAAIVDRDSAEMSALTVERRFPVRAIVLLGAKPDSVRITSSARRLASLAPLVERPHAALRATDLEAVGRLATRTEVIRALGYDTEELPAILADLAQTA